MDSGSLQGIDVLQAPQHMWPAGRNTGAAASVAVEHSQTPPRPCGRQGAGERLLHRTHSDPSKQTGVTGWLEGWKRLAEEQGCAVGRPASGSTSSSGIFVGPCLTQDPRPASAPLLWQRQQELPLTTPSLAGLQGNPLTGTVHSAAAPPPFTRYASPFYDTPAAAAAAAAAAAEGCSAEELLFRMQQEQVFGGSMRDRAETVCGGSEDSGASPLRSYGSACTRDEDLRSCRSLRSGLSSSTQAGPLPLLPSFCAGCGSQDLQDPLRATANLQQQQQGNGSFMSSPAAPPARRSGLDGYRGAARGSARDAAPAPAPAWADAASTVFGSPGPAVPAPRTCGVKRRSEDLLHLTQSAPAALSWDLPREERRRLRQSPPAAAPRPAPPPSADYSLSSFFSAGTGSAGLAAPPAVDLSQYPHPAPPPAAAAVAATAAYTQREAAMLSTYMDALAAVELLGDAAGREAEELAFGDADLAAAAAEVAGCLPAAHSSGLFAPHRLF